MIPSLDFLGVIEVDPDRFQIVPKFLSVQSSFGRDWWYLMTLNLPCHPAYLPRYKNLGKTRSLLQRKLWGLQ